MVYEKVYEYCEKNKISVMEFEQMCELSNGTVGKWASKNYDPSIKSLQKIVKATGIPVEKWV